MKIKTNCKSGIKGSYVYSCKDCKETPQGDGWILLECDCKTINGNYTRSSLRVLSYYTGEVDNCNGTLKLGSCSQSYGI